MTTSNTQDAEILRQFIQRSGASPKAQVEAIEALERMQQYHAARGDDLVTLGLEIGRRTAAIAGKDSEIESHKTTRRMWQERCEALTAAVARKDAALRDAGEWLRADQKGYGGDSYELRGKLLATIRAAL